MALDADSSGTLSLPEIKEGYCKKFGAVMTDTELEDLFNAADTDNNGSLDFNEFLKAACNKDSLKDKENLRIAFDVFDKDKSGKLDLGELKSILLMFENNLKHACSKCDKDDNWGASQTKTI